MSSSGQASTALRSPRHAALRWRREYDVPVSEPSLAAAFLAELTDEPRARFDDRGALDAILTRLRAEAAAAYPDLAVDADRFAAELARRLGPLASPAQLATVRAAHVHLAIACAAGDPSALRTCEDELFDEVGFAAARVRARPDQADDARGRLRHLLFTAEPGRKAGMAAFSGRSDLRSYIKVIATRELVKLVEHDRRAVPLADDMADALVAAADGPELAVLRERYRDEVRVAIRAALAALPDASRALLRYSVVDGWSVDRIGALYGVHRATAARRVAAARDELGTAIRRELAARLSISVDEVDSIIRLVQSRIDLSLERLLG